MSSPVSFWEREEWLSPPDLLIVGAGIVGASVALFYKEKYPESDVVVIDKGITPEGASTRNAGFACIGSVSEHLADMKIAGEKTVLNRIERRWNGLKLLKSVMGEQVIGYENTGGYEIFTDRKIFETCREQVPVLNNKLKQRLGLDDVYSLTELNGYPAIFNRVEGAINSGKLMRSLHRKISNAGVRVWWNCEAEKVDSSYVKLKSGVELHPKNVVLATNGFAPQLADLKIKPARGYVFVTEPVKDLKWRGTFHYHEGYVYFRNVGKRLLLGGARHLAKEEETTDHFGTNEIIKEWLFNFADDVLNLPAGWKPEMEWSGIMGMTENKEPAIRQLKPHLYAAAGLSGMGIAIGMEVARGLVELISV